MRRFYFFQPRVFARSNYANNKGDEQTWTPWFALILAPIAELFGYEPILVDARVESDWENLLLKIQKEDILGISVITGKSISDSKTASKIAQEKGAFVIWGGPHVSLFPEDTLMCAPLDAIVSGIGTKQLYNLLTFLHSANRQGVDNFGFLLKNEIGTKRTIQIASSSYQEYFAPSLKIIDNWESYVNADEAISDRVINYISTEGCSCNCTFCSEPVTSKKKLRESPIEQCIENMHEMIHLAKSTGIKFHDPNFFINKKRAEQLSEKIKAQIKQPWAASMHPRDLISYPQSKLDMFFDRGLKRLLIGLESPIQEIVNYSGKNYDSTKIYEMATKLGNAGIVGMFTFIVGWPKQDYSHYQKTIDCAYKIKEIYNPHQCKIHFLEPWPGSLIFKELQKDGFIFPRTLDEWERIDYYLAQYGEIHDKKINEVIRHANKELCPYIFA